MAKQVLEIEDVDTMERIKTVDDAARFLSDKRICEDILDSLSRLPESSFEWKVAAYRAVVATVTYNEQRHLNTGERWFPSIEFCSPDKLKNCCGKTVVGRIKSEGKEFNVVGGYAFYGAAAGLGFFSSHYGVGLSNLDIGFRSVGSKKAALYISKQFGKLLFEVSYGGTNCDWKWTA